MKIKINLESSKIDEENNLTINKVENTNPKNHKKKSSKSDPNKSRERGGRGNRNSQIRNNSKLRHSLSKGSRRNHHIKVEKKSEDANDTNIRNINSKKPIVEDSSRKRNNATISLSFPNNNRELVENSNNNTKEADSNSDKQTNSNQCNNNFQKKPRRWEKKWVLVPNIFDFTKEIWLKQWVVIDDIDEEAQQYLLNSTAYLENYFDNNYSGRLKETVSRKYQCSFDECGKIFVDASSLKKHMLTHGEKQFICKYEGCGKKFLDNSKLRRHQLVHTGEKPFKCDLCGKKFSLDFNLKTHLRTHTGEKPYFCSYAGCDKRFTQSSNLTAHEKTHKEMQDKFEKITLNHGEEIKATMSVRESGDSVELNEDKNGNSNGNGKSKSIPKINFSVTTSKQPPPNTNLSQSQIVKVETMDKSKSVMKPLFNTTLTRGVASHSSKSNLGNSAIDCSINNNLSENEEL